MKTNTKLEDLTTKELLTTNGGGDAWEKIGEWVGEMGTIWGNSNQKSWEICQKKGIKNRRDC